MMDVVILLLVGIALSTAKKRTCEKFVKLSVKADTRSVANWACRSYLSNKDSPDYKGVIDVHDDKDFSPNETTEYVVGSVYKSNQYTWSDGTRIGDTFWADGEPRTRSKNAVILWRRNPNYAGSDMNVLSTASSNSVDQKPVVCRTTTKCNSTKTKLAAEDIEALEITECEKGWEKRAFCGQVNCYKTIKISRSKKAHDDHVVHDICAKKHPGSHLVSIHCKKEYEFVRSQPYFQLIGFYIPQSKRRKFKASNFQWTDRSKVNYVNWAKKYNDCVGKKHPLKPGTKVCAGTVAYHAYLGKNHPMNNIHGGIERAFCKKPASLKPKTTTTAPVPPPTTLITTTEPPRTWENTVCSHGWVKKEFCGTISCYQPIQISSNIVEQEKYVENDICARQGKGYLVSIHCREEYEYVRNHRTFFLIGFYLPKSLRKMWHPSQFRWTDGSPIDYVQWTDNHYHCPTGAYPLDPHRYRCYIPQRRLVNQAYMGFGTYMNNVHGGTHDALCKKPPSLKI